MKIESHRLEIKDTCKPEYIEAIKKYWVLEKNKFINKSKYLGLPFNLSAYEFGSLVKRESSFFIELKCQTCPNTESFQVTSHSNLSIIKRNTYNSYTTLFNCPTCKKEIQDKKKEELKKLEELQIEKQSLAIKNQVWSSLNSFELNVLHSIIKIKDFSKLHYNFKKTPYKTIWSAIYTLKNLNLIVLHFHENSNYVHKVSYLPELESVLPQVEPKVKKQSKIVYNNTTRELKFRFTKNNVIKDKNGPLYNGVLNFEEDILIEKGTQYTFGVWKRELDDLYFTLVPTDSIYKAPRQQSISSQPKHLRDAIQDFFNSSGFDS